MVAYLPVFAIAFVGALALMPVARLVASRVGAIDVPGELSIHTRPGARTGGLAILLAVLAATGFALWRGDLPAGAFPVNGRASSGKPSGCGTTLKSIRANRPLKPTLVIRGTDLLPNIGAIIMMAAIRKKTRRKVAKSVSSIPRYSTV